VTTETDAAPESRGSPIYFLHDVVKIREAKGVAFRLRIPSLRIDRGEKIALIGESGSGKSTLLDMLAFILQPSAAGSFRFRPDGRWTSTRAGTLTTSTGWVTCASGISAT